MSPLRVVAWFGGDVFDVDPKPRIAGSASSRGLSKGGSLMTMGIGIVLLRFVRPLGRGAALRSTACR